MSREASAQFSDAERGELDRVVETLAGSPRLAHLLRYMGAKLATGDVEQLNEYNIATEVFGRSATTFRTAEDAIARVETHRLRKCLATFYEREGRDNPVQVTLPARSYVPVFLHKPEETHSAASSVLLDAPGADARGGRQPWRWIGRRWKYLLFGACFALVLSAAWLHLRSGALSVRAKPVASPGLAPALASVPPLPGVTSPAIRLLAGYDGPPRTDSAGIVWNGDQYFSAGGGWRRPPGLIARASDPFIFEHSRTGDFSYEIPLKPGLYELHLFFSTPLRADESISTFSVLVNGDYVLGGFDINADALGHDIADERVFRDVSPRKDGFLHLAFSGALGIPTVDAIEILPGLRHAQLPMRLIMQSTPLTDHKGQLWHPDDLFSRERYGHFNYAMPVDTRDRYTVVLHFAELYFGSGMPGNGGVGSRIFKVMCNGETLLDNFDILKEAATLHEVTKIFHHLKPSAQGKLNLTFEPISNNATVCGIEVLDESQ